MEIHNGLKYGADTVGALGLAVGLSKDASGIERFGETLQPIMNPWERPEWSLFRRELLLTGQINTGPIAAEFSGGAVVLPAANQRGLLVVDAVKVRTYGTAMQVNLSVQTEASIIATYTSSAVMQVRDTRCWVTGGFGSNSPVLQYGGSDPAGFANIMEEETLVALMNYAKFQSTPWIIRPGFGLCVVAATVNVGMIMNFVARYRQLLTGEMISGPP